MVRDMPAVCAGALLAACLYILAGMDEWMVPWRIVNLSVWLLSAAACLSFVTDVGRELPRFSPLIGLCFSAVCLFMFLYLAVEHFMADVVMAEPIRSTLLVAVSVAVLFIARRPSGIVPIVLSAIVCFVGGVAAVQFATRYGIALEIARTETAKGCVLGRDSARGRRISGASELRLGWIIGAHSERVFFIRDEGAFQWDYSRLRPSPLHAWNRTSSFEICGPEPFR